MYNYQFVIYYKNVGTELAQSEKGQSLLSPKRDKACSVRKGTKLAQSERKNFTKQVEQARPLRRKK